MNKQKGFTLIEVVTAILLMAVIAAVIYPKFIDIIPAAKAKGSLASRDAVKTGILLGRSQNLLTKAVFVGPVFNDILSTHQWKASSDLSGVCGGNGYVIPTFTDSEGTQKTTSLGDRVESTGAPILSEGCNDGGVSPSLNPPLITPTPVTNPPSTTSTGGGSAGSVPVSTTPPTSSGSGTVTPAKQYTIYTVTSPFGHSASSSISESDALNRLFSSPTLQYFNNGALLNAQLKDTKIVGKVKFLTYNAIYANNSFVGNLVFTVSTKESDTPIESSPSLGYGLFNTGFTLQTSLYNIKNAPISSIPFTLEDYAYKVFNEYLAKNSITNPESYHFISNPDSITINNSGGNLEIIKVQISPVVNLSLPL